MRHVEYRDRRCLRCEEWFSPKAPSQKYCCAECRDLEYKPREKAIQKEYYAKYKKVKPHDRTCKKCGNIFQGMYCQGYCPDCLRSGGSTMNRLRLNRKDEV